jgi:predicted dehydrogenase
MSRRVRLGIVGTSWWTDYLYVPSLVGYPGAEVVALCGRNQANAAALAKKYGVGQVFTDYRELIERGGIEALIVATPDDTHFPIVMAALDAGLHVLCEKPLANNAAPVREMYEKAQAAGVKHTVMFTYRWLPQYVYLRELVAEGYLGRCLHADLQCMMHYSRDGYKWRFDRRRANGVLGDLGSHMIDLARWYLGEVVAVQARLATIREWPGPEGQPGDPANDLALLTLEFAGGALATVQISALAHPTYGWSRHHVALFGDAGTLEADLHRAATLQAARPGAEPGELPVPDRLWGAGDRSDALSVLFANPVGPREFVDAIANDLPIGPTFYDGLKTQEVVDAAFLSHERGGWVRIGE